MGSCDGQIRHTRNITFLSTFKCISNFCIILQQPLLRLQHCFNYWPMNMGRVCVVALATAEHSRPPHCHNTRSLTAGTPSAGHRWQHWQWRGPLVWEEARKHRSHGSAATGPQLGWWWCRRLWPSAAFSCNHIEKQPCGTVRVEWSMLLVVVWLPQCACTVRV